MKSLKWLREQGEMMNRDERAQPHKLSIPQNTKLYALLYKSALPMNEATEQLDRQEHEKYLTELQSRLYRIGQWEKRRDRDLQKLSKTTKKTRRKSSS